LKVALVCAEVIRESGHGRYMLELARRLAARHEVHVYSHLFQPVPGVTHHPVPAHLGVNLWRLLTFWWRASRAVGREPYDVVHTIGGCCARRDVVTAQFCQRPWGAELARLAADDRRARRAGQPPLLPGSRLRHLYHHLYWRVADMFEAPAFRPRRGKRLIAVSAGVREELVRWYGVPRDAVAVIPNGVEPTEFAAEALAPLRAPTREALGLPAASPVVLYVGDFHRKGLAVALAAFAAAAPPTAWLLVVGRGEYETFQAHAARLGVADRLLFTGFVPDTRPYFAAADAFVFPTRYEPFGIVVTEAMAAGLPVITTRVAGAAEVIADGVDGLLVDDATDVAAFARALGEVLGDAQRAEALGRAARAKAATVSWERIAVETEAIYEALVAERAGPPQG
jgi:UDP-glucose:(heptosyl)LPS alpha-1,3-glucosyltransferase